MDNGCHEHEVTLNNNIKRKQEFCTIISLHFGHSGRYGWHNCISFNVAHSPQYSRVSSRAAPCMCQCIIKTIGAHDSWEVGEPVAAQTMAASDSCKCISGFSLMARH